jgi:two-component system response regulator NreC
VKLIANKKKAPEERTVLLPRVVNMPSADHAQVRIVKSVVIADDHRIVRDGLRSLLEERESGFRCVGEAEDGTGAVKMAKELRPDIVIMDISMPNLSGIDATREIKAALPDTKVIVLSMHANRSYVIEVLRAGASAYLLKDSTFGQLTKALESASKGEIYLSPGITEVDVATDRTGRGIEAINLRNRLTNRELQVLRLIGDGNSTKEIAAKLMISVKTVETHRKQIIEKLGIRTIAGLTKFCIREGLTSL